MQKSTIITLMALVSLSGCASVTLTETITENGSVCIASINEPIKATLKTKSCELIVDN